MGRLLAAGIIALMALGAPCFVIAWSSNTTIGITSDQASMAIFGLGLVAMGVVNYLLGVAFRRRR